MTQQFMQKKTTQIILLRLIQFFFFFLNLHYDGANSYLFVNGTEIIKFKVKDSENLPYPLCLRNVSQYFSVNNTKKKWTAWTCLWF